VLVSSAEVLLVERYNHLGGLSTGGLVIWIDRMTDWTGRPVISGIGQELLDRLGDRAVADAPRSIWGSTEAEDVAYWRERQGAFRDTVTLSPMIDPEWLKFLSQMLIEAGVKLLLHSWVADPLIDDRTLAGVTFESKEGRRAILATVVIDATGDLDLCARAGLEFEADAKAGGGGIAHCLNTGWLWAGVDFARWRAFKRDDTAAAAASAVNITALRAELRRQRVYLQDDSTGAMNGGPPRGPNVSITADTPLL
jgi:hypothetical protein